MGSYSLLEHPADVGVEARGENPEAAFAAAAEGLVSVMVDPATVRPAASRRVALEAADMESLLVRFLNEIIFFFDTEHFIVSSVEIPSIESGRLDAVLNGEILSHERHCLRTDVKAATYHQLSITQIRGTWVIRVFFDI